MVRVGAWLAIALALGACVADDIDSAPEVHFAAEGPSCSASSACVTDRVQISEVEGIDVVHRPLPGSPVVAMSVAFDGGAGRWTAAQAHAEAAVARLSNWYGSKNRIRTWDGDVAGLGATFNAGSGLDYATFTMVAPTVHFEQSWRLLADAVIEPPVEVSPPGLAQIKASFLHEFEAANDEAPSAASQAAWSLLVENHPYALRDDAPHHVPGLTAGDLTAALDEMRRKPRMSVVVVGDVARADVERLVAESFRRLTASGGTPIAALPPFTPNATRAVILDYPEAPAFHVMGFFPAPSPEQPDYAALELGLRVLTARLFNGVRIERGLVYAIGAGVATYRTNYGSLTLSSVEPAAAMEATRAIVDALIAEGIDDAELEGERARYVTAFYQANDTAAGLGHTLLDWRLTTAGAVTADDHLARIATVTADEARAAVARYLPQIRYAAAGPPSIALDEAALAGDPAPEATAR